MRELAPELEITILFNDLPSNDFELAEKVASEHFAETKNLRFSFLGKSFYEELADELSFNFIGCFTAMHWLSRLPGPLHGNWFGHSGVEDES